MSYATDSGLMFYFPPPRPLPATLSLCQCWGSVGSWRMTPVLRYGSLVALVLFRSLWDSDSFSSIPAIWRRAQVLTCEPSLRVQLVKPSPVSKNASAVLECWAPLAARKGLPAAGQRELCPDDQTVVPPSGNHRASSAHTLDRRGKPWGHPALWV